MNIGRFEIIVMLFVLSAMGLGLYLRTSTSPALSNVTTKPPAEEHKTEHPTFVLPVDETQPLHIGILGESGDGEHGEAFNTAIVKQLLKGLQKQHVEAVFETGNLVSGLANKVSDKTSTSSNRAFQQQLVAFSEMYKAVLRDKVPFFPVMGDHELAVPNGEIIFREHFHLKNGVRFDEHGFGYTVVIGKAFFVVLANTDKAKAQAGQLFNPEILEWLQNVLRDGASSYEYLFVVGHAPIFPHTTTLTDHQAQARDAFWKILIDNKVVAYFSSHEHAFDRSQRHGVWQVISGGGGAPLREGGRSKSFYHCLLLTIPATKQTPPFIEVLDIEGEVVDRFELIPMNSLIYQRHVS